MKRLVLLAAISLTAALALAPAAQADFGLSEFDVRFTEKDGTPARQAGSHPYKMTTSFLINHSPGAGGKLFPDGGDIKDLIVDQIEGFVGSTTAVPQCDTIDFAIGSCGLNTVVGATAAFLNGPEAAIPVAVFNLVPPPGVPARLGFITTDVPLVIDVGVKDSPDYNVRGGPRNIPQPLTVFGAVLELWGVPALKDHDFARGSGCITIPDGDIKKAIKDGELNLIEGPNTCPANVEPKPFLTLPRACEGPLLTTYELDPWDAPGAWVFGSDVTEGFIGCGKLPFAPTISSQATSDSAGTSSGLDFSITFNDQGLVSPEGIAQSDIKKTVVSLPEGVTANPSIAEGLGVCTPADLDRETLASAPGEGCPNASKIGTVSVQTPLLDQAVTGSVFLASQDDPSTAAKENPFDSLLAFYIVLKEPSLGVLVKVPAKVEPDPLTGQLVTTVDDIPQFPFSRFDFHFREGQRAPLITPEACGTYATEVRFTPWARPSETVTESASFQITRGVGGGACPPGGVPPFKPGFEAGSLNNDAASYSPFLMRLTRSDGEQDMTKFSAVLPPGVLGKLAGVDFCPEAQIALAKAKSGRAEQGSPSCPANSLIGHTLGGAGVGSTLTYVPGALYLAGPHKGAPLSVVAITPAVAGPFDVGTVVVRVALTLNPRSGQVEVDGAASDPIPHILKGLPLKLRDLRVEADRPQFTLNPTSCDEYETRATLFGSYLNLFSSADDVPVALSSRYQAAGCSRLGFEPRLGLRLKGGTKRGAHPALRAVVTPRPGDANFSRAVVTLPRSAFLDQGHIRTICTRVQFAAGAGNGTLCPPGSVYGKARAWSPLLDAPLSGPVFLRSSDNNLPDLVVALHGPPSAAIDIELSARIDSVKGGIRSTFTGVPDAPVSRFILDMQGGKKGLIVNSRNLCVKPGRNRAKSNLRGQNGKFSKTRPRVVATTCRQHRKAKRASASRGLIAERSASRR